MHVSEFLWSFLLSLSELLRAQVSSLTSMVMFSISVLSMVLAISMLSVIFTLVHWFLRLSLTPALFDNAIVRIAENGIRAEGHWVSSNNGC